MYVISKSLLQAWIKCHIQIQYQSQSHQIAITVKFSLAIFTQVAKGKVLQCKVSAAYPSIY
jgi:hypothetical protein